MLANATTAARDCYAPLRREKRIRASEAIVRAIRTPLPSGGWGRYSIDQTPYMVEPMDVIASRVFEALVFAGPAQSGKTLGLIDGAACYSVTESPAACQIIQTSQFQAEDFAKLRLQLLIDNTPEMAALKSSRKSDDNVLTKIFTNGSSIRVGWPSVGQVSGKAVRRMLATDLDNMTGDLKPEELFGMMLKRITTFMSSGIVVCESSPARDYTDASWSAKTPHEAPPSTGILLLYNRGDRRRWFWPCVECREPFQAAPGVGGFALPSFDELSEILKTADSLALAEKYAKLVCPHCAVTIEHRWKRTMNKAGRWVGEGQTMHADGSITGQRVHSRTASFWLGGVAAGYQTWESLLDRYFQAIKTYATTGESKSLKTTVNVDQGDAFRPLAVVQARGAEELKARRENYPQGVVPPGVRYLTVQVDIQAGLRPKFVVQVQGWGVAQQSWIIDRYALVHSPRPTGVIKEDGTAEYFPLDPASYLEDWARLIDKVIRRTYPLGDGSGRVMRMRAIGCDSGGKAGVTPKAYDFWRSLKGLGIEGNVRLIKGGSAKKAPTIQETFPDDRKRADRQSGARGDVPLLLLNTDTLKDTVTGNAYRATPGPGYMHFGSWLADSFFDELTAETRGADGWDDHGRKNESLDLCVYGMAMVLSVGGDRIDWTNPPSWAQTWDTNSYVRMEDGAPQPKPEGPKPQAKKPARTKLRVVRSPYVHR